MTIKPSDITNKILIPAGVTPSNDSSQFPSHYSSFGHGGLRSVADNTERDAIPAPRKVVGMLVYVSGDDAYYMLESDLTTWTLINLTSETFHSTFNATTDWTLVTGTTANFTIDFTHNLNTANIEYVIYDENNNFVFACVTQESNARLRITINAPVTRFAGRITINREG